MVGPVDTTEDAAARFAVAGAVATTPASDARDPQRPPRGE
jgi:hypothetical protein